MRKERERRKMPSFSHFFSYRKKSRIFSPVMPNKQSVPSFARLIFRLRGKRRRGRSLSLSLSVMEEPSKPSPLPSSTMFPSNYVGGRGGISICLLPFSFPKGEKNGKMCVGIFFSLSFSPLPVLKPI